MSPEAIPTSTSESPHQSEFEYHLRIYRDADKQQVWRLFENAMFWHSHSPLRPLLKIVAKSSVMKALYLTSAFGAVIWLSRPTLGITICVAAAGVVLLQMGYLSVLILKFTRDSLQDDLGDILGHYKLTSLSSSDKAGAGFVPLGPRAFWVVEARHKVSGETELVGCVGLDIVDKERSVGELRRMVVSGQHLRRGVAASLVHALVAHAKSHRLSSIFLTTSNSQEGAVHLYKRFGWIEENRQSASVFLAGVEMISLRLILSEKNLVD